MVHAHVFKRFLRVTGMPHENIQEWFPNGKNSIRVRVRYCHDVLVFTTSEETKDWRIETVGMFVDELRAKID